MNTLEHPVAPEEIMAMLDEELSSAERQSVLEHIEHCAECAAMRLRLESTTRLLAEWPIPVAPETLDREVERAAAARPGNSSKPSRHFTRLAWATGGVLAAVLVLAVIGVNAPFAHDKAKQRTLTYLKPENAAPATEDSLSTPTRADLLKGGLNDLAPKPSRFLASIGGGGGAPMPSVALPQAAAPMIARQVSLTILVKNIPQARTALDGILSIHAGYAATLDVSTPESGSPTIAASLRIPAQQLEAALVHLRTLGHVEGESQSGEEVTEQHADLVARLQNARESEDRLRAILAQRTGKMDEVLQVEEQIGNTRGEIERMEAEQKALEHRVDYGSVDLKLTEQYEARLTGQPTTVGTQLRNSLVTGIQDAGSSLLGLALLLEETGPAILVWTALLGFPAWIFWRRYRRAQSRL
jgi:hypothetical protein